ncbi:hypothetical protein B7463_g2581, partial [Scytalidium lignicola]
MMATVQTMSGQIGPTSTENGAPPPGRACHECSRKKTKCDMKHPICGLCQRTGSVCSFPLKRKAPALQDPYARKKNQTTSENLTRLVQLLEANRVVNYEQSHLVLANEVPLASHAGDDDTGPSEANLSVDFEGSSRSTLDRSRDAGSLMMDFFASLSPEKAHRRLPPVEQQQQTSTMTTAGATAAVAAGSQFVPQQVQEPQYTSNENEIYSDRVSAPNTYLLELFFQHVQPWLPILHKPSVLRRYEAVLEGNGSTISNLPVDQTLLLYGMCALSARFSSTGTLARMSECERGDAFASRARELYSRSRDLCSSTLTNLQGCILLAFYYYTSGISSHGWVITGVCVRLAYELGLSEIDDEVSEVSEGMDWV